MTVIDEEAFVMLMTFMCVVTIYAAWLRLFTVRRLRKRVDRLVDERLSRTAEPSQAQQTAPVPQTDVAEFARVQQRVAVLERIITDGGLQTAAQIDALRSPGERLAYEQVR
ncbi:hypothetical protein OMW55_04260 [Sphingomonas sp. BN140010]|uniref:Uncharacterized protein n=1 Tax=Sphingomonas arvum TaxID=2992113 RepID=A0ABT3JD71_9SPHN|nr:hypothetical protein [Sphingomonas sp. BN140010]MCW3797017.1 hypothetical protein [Sphingomonas sp. BN140010]